MNNNIKYEFLFEINLIATFLSVLKLGILFPPSVKEKIKLISFSFYSSFSLFKIKKSIYFFCHLDLLRCRFDMQEFFFVFDQQNQEYRDLVRPIIKNSKLCKCKFNFNLPSVQ